MGENEKLPKETQPDKPEPENHDNYTIIDGDDIDRDVDEIVAAESDELLEAEDEAFHAEPLLSKPHRGFWGSIGHGFSSWWRNKTARYLTLIILVVAVSGLAFVATTRYWILNHVGVRCSASATAIDELTQQPLKNVTVKIAGQTVITTSSGEAKFAHLKLGPTTLSIVRPGFSEFKRKVTLGWGSNPFGNVGLRASGAQYTFVVKDYVTGKPLQGVEVGNGDAAALSDQNGKAVLTMPTSDSGEIVATVKYDNYRTEDITVKAATVQPVPVTLVTAHKAVYVSKKSATYDVYSSDVDGQNAQIVLAGTGNESDSIGLVVSPDGSQAAVVSTRSGQRDADGILINTLTLVDLGNGSNSTIAQTSQIKLIDWAGTRLVYEQIASSQDTPAGSRYIIKSYDYSSGSRYQLASAALFKAVLSAQGTIYYATAPSADDTTPPALYKVNPDGSSKTSVLQKEVWNAYRTDYGVISLQTDSGWYSYNISSNSASSITAPSAYTGRIYVENPANNGKSLWVNTSNGQGILTVHSRNDNKDVISQRQTGLTYPVRWLTDDSAIYRQVTSSETADYAISAAGGGQPHKIADVVNTYGFMAGQ
ncbi:MAG TPA: hypothetical protein VMR45_02030 [Patescibacteria group bacterium]|nr:hypothetical protein [Patescibacteria group bacterium]